MYKIHHVNTTTEKQLFSGSAYPSPPLPFDKETAYYQLDQCSMLWGKRTCCSEQEKPPEWGLAYQEPNRVNARACSIISRVVNAAWIS